MNKLLSGLVAGIALLAAAPAALAADVTVDLRIEGRSSTLFEGPVTTDIRPLRFTGETTEHQCDGTNTGSSPRPVPTRGAALMAAATQTPFSIRGTWSDQFGATFTEVGGENVAFDPGTGRFLAEYKNARFANVGACGDPIANGDRVVFAYGDGSEQLLALTGPASARPGESVTVKVSNAADGSPIGGATVGGHSTAADGTAAVGPFSQRGSQDFKASKPGTIRSNRLRVCVSDGSDGFCGAGTGGSAEGPPAPPASDTAGPGTAIRLRAGKVFRHRRGPRTLRGTAAPDPSGLYAVKLRLKRRVGRHCSFFSGRRERFRRMPCSRSGAFVTVGDRADWSYLLPKRLRRGRYLLEAYAIDRAFNRGETARVRFRVK
jgi:hypothetical protein